MIRTNCLMAAILLTLAPSTSLAQQAVILVRHADRDPKRPDELTEAGRLRARALSRALKDAGITAIVISDAKRTRDTAAPIAESLKLKGTANEIVVKYDPSHVDNAWKAIRGCGKDAVVLYVGHSDTIEPMLRKLGYQGAISLTNVIVVVPKETGPVVVQIECPKE